ncbi:hypothetical protein [Chachezhania antarctica]|uniref:hypothetical protein n=1 Tax=Chachezhania antarctica TaxID=2340860 RepID=UPI000EABC9C7|nr:hypothetical protein [Chachezhania antarctica]|tara:strand:- start:2104 stop:2325 length:222 start_codon:yes stop_codon:yes gene_type:complete
MTKTVNPTTEAIAFRVWQHCEPIGWNCTVADAAEAVGEPLSRVRRIIGHKGWGGRFRATRTDISAVYEVEAQG